MKDGRSRELDQYLSRYAEPEGGAAAAAPIDAYARALIVPVHRERAELLDGYLTAARQAPGRTLCVLVVNDSRVRRESLDSLEALLSRLADVRVLSETPRLLLGALPELDVLLVDRVSPGHTFPEKQGVGLARKIGCDVAVALWTAGRVASPVLFTSDADVVLAADYFDVELGSAAAGLYPFWHERSGDDGVDRATALYEISLRYYVLGLRHARSPYAVHTIGSTIAIDARAYARVRGFPRRAAGEDFYMLDKLAKVAPLVALPRAPIAIRSRRSERVPFGTGKGVGRLLEAGCVLELYDPELFVALRHFLTCLDSFADRGDTERFLRDLRAGPGASAARLGEIAGGWRLADVLASARGQAREPMQLRRRLHTWFDAFRTLKLLHTLRDAGLPMLPWRSALAKAAFLPQELAREEDLDAVRRTLLALERTGPEPLGPTRPTAL